MASKNIYSDLMEIFTMENERNLWKKDFDFPLITYIMQTKRIKKYF